MNVAIVGAGNIGGNIATQLVKAGHNVVITFSQSEERLQERAKEISGVTTAPVADAVRQSDVVVLATMWDQIDKAVEQAGDLTGKIVIDATNQYDSTGLVALETSVAEHNQARMPGARMVRSFNMFTAGFEKQVAEGEYGPIAMFYATESRDAKEVAEQVIADSGFKPVYLGGWDVAGAIEVPAGMLVGKSYLVEDARAIVQAFEQGDLVRAKGLADSKDLGR